MRIEIDRVHHAIRLDAAIDLSEASTPASSSPTGKRGSRDIIAHVDPSALWVGGFFWGSYGGRRIWWPSTRDASSRMETRKKHKIMKKELRDRTDAPRRPRPHPSPFPPSSQDVQDRPGKSNGSIRTDNRPKPAARVSKHPCLAHITFGTSTQWKARPPSPCATLDSRDLFLSAWQPAYLSISCPRDRRGTDKSIVQYRPVSPPPPPPPPSSPHPPPTRASRWASPLPRPDPSRLDPYNK